MAPVPVIPARRLDEAASCAPPSLGPQSVGIALTNACNLNCVTCWSYSPLRRELPRVDWMRRRLDADLLERLFADLAAMATERVIFTGGGDPLAHPQFYTIARSASAAGLKTTLISNLTRPRDPDRLVATGLDTVLANFSCGNAASYAAFHPGRGAADFSRLLDVLHRLSDEGTHIRLVYVVCAVNVEAMAGAIEIASDLGASVQFKRVSVTEETASLDLAPAEWRRLLARLPALAAQADSAGVDVNWGAFASALRGDDLAAASEPESGCWAGHYYSRVTASGDVFFCCNQHPSLRVGSLYESSFADLWRSERYQAIRTQLHHGGFVPGCDRCGKRDLNYRVGREIRQRLAMVP